MLNKLKKDGFKILNIGTSNRHKLKSKLQTEFDENFDGEKENNYNILITTSLGGGINLHRSNIIINYDTQELNSIDTKDRWD